DSEEDTDSGEEPNVKDTVVEPTRKSSSNQILKILKQYGEEEKQREQARLDLVIVADSHVILKQVVMEFDT
ncbi:hypothetical protein DPMN_083009, partial [Dreissena polymorpha]